MKGLLLKEFYIWLKTRSWIILYVIAINIISIGSGRNAISVAGIGVLSGSILSSFLTDEKNNWPNYCKALPCTPFERVSAKYIIHFSELFIAICAYVASSVLSHESYYSKAEIFVSPGKAHSYAESALMIAVFILFFAIELPVGFKFKGTLRTVIGIIPVSAFFVFWMTITLAASNGDLIVFSEQKYLTAMIIGASLVFLAASWTLSVIIETNQNGSYKNKFKKAAIIFTVIAVAISSVTFALYLKNTQKPATNETGKYDSMDDTETVTQEINKYYDSFCDKLRVGTKLYDYTLGLEEAGFVKDKKRTDIYYSESGNIMIDIGVSYSSEDKIGNLTVTCKYAQKTFENATYASFKNLKLNFNKGMTVAELHEKFNELEIIPNTIEEDTFKDVGRRKYRFEFIAYSFEDEEKPVKYDLSIETDGEKVTDITDLMLYLEDQSPVPTDPKETSLEIAGRNIADYLQQLCDENNIEKTPREFIRDLRNMGYTESEETYDLYYSESKKVSVSLTTDENDALEKITVIPNYGEIKYIESATDEDLNKLTADFTIGMSEAKFIEKIIEIDMLPDTLTEEFGENKEHLRTYEFKYHTYNYNGNGSEIFFINIDVVGGKVSDIAIL